MNPVPAGPMRIRFTAFIFALPILTVPLAASTPEEAAQALAGRVVPGLAGQLSFEPVSPDPSGNDVFEIEEVGGRIVLRGNNGVAMASALNLYLEEFCGCEVSWHCGNQLAVPDQAPPVPRKIRVVSPHRFRYAYNYCTHGYTMAWWDWPAWEGELDFLALKGVNLALIIEGQEQVWIDALGKFGYTDDAVRRWLVLPAHQPWQYMSNMEDYGGPLSRSLVARRIALGRRIVGRMRELGMEPVLQGYYGMVPSDFKTRFPGAKVHAQGSWGGMSRPDMLDPLDPLFARLAAEFYRAESAAYPGNPRFLAADPFHEGGSTDGMDLAACGRSIYAAMDRADPGATWVLQSWQENPRQSMIDALDKSRLLVLDLFCESRENWRARNQFGHTPWLWCTIHNFGGNVGLSGNLDLLRAEPAKALAEAGPGRGQMSGIGALMEGSGTQPILWEMFFGNAWRSEAPDADAWLADYGRRRYGGDSPEALRALRILGRTVYGPGVTGFPVNSVVCARPTMDPFPKGDFWGTTRPFYDTTALVGAWRSLLDAAPACQASDGYRYDLADVGRQVLADLFARYHQAILRAYARRDSQAIAELGGRALGLLRDLDGLLATRREFLLGDWLAGARSFGSTDEERGRCERDSRELLTTWVDRETDTVDYANREWSGLVATFYLPRWQTWFQGLESAASSGAPADVAAIRARIVAGDHAWTLRRGSFATEPSGSTLAISRRLYARYGAEASESAEAFTSSH